LHFQKIPIPIPTIMVSISKCSTEGIPTIRQLSEEIWRKVYPSIVSMEQIDYMLDLMYSSKALEEQITSLGHQFILLNHNNESVGYASYSIKKADEPERYRLHKLYLKPELQGKGFGKAMTSYISTEVISQGGTELELNVNKKNPAVAFYNHIGFIIESEIDLQIGQGFEMNDFIMVLKLQ